MTLACVDQALQGLELLRKDFVALKYPLKDLQMGLRHVRTFLLWERKWHNDIWSISDENTSSTLDSLLSRLERALLKKGKDFHNLCLTEMNGIGEKSMSLDMFERAYTLRRCIYYSFSQEITESYIKLSGCCSLQSRSQSTEFIDSLLVNMADIRDRYFTEGQEPIEDLKENLAFFKNFIRFVKLRGCEPWQLQLLFTHLEEVAFNTARLCHEWMFHSDKYKLQDNFRLMFSELLQKIKHVDPQICETFAQVLKASSLSGSSCALTLETDKYILGDFIDSLLYNILESLMFGNNYMVALKDPVLILQEGLRFLRTILTKHLEKIDELHGKVKDLIGAAVNEAGFVICSLPIHELEEGLSRKMDFALSKFLEMIKPIKVITSAFIFPKKDVLGFMDFLLENLKELPTCKLDSIASAKDQIQTVQEDLVSLTSFLENILDQHNQDENVQCLWSRAVEVAYKIPFIILSLVVGDILDRSPLEFKSITEEINLIKMESLKIVDNHYSSEAQKATKTSNPSPSHGFTHGVNKIVLTLDDEVNTIIEQLIRGSKQLDIISIVGMPGLGKTTLARSVYDDPSVRELFHTHAWCVVSQVYKKKDLLLQILSDADPDFSDEYSMENEYKLEEKLKKCLLRKRYLIVLDDVWDIEAWSDLERSFPNDANSSRILLTSRQADVAKKINPNRKPHPLRQMTDNESWDLLQKKLSCKEDYPMDLGEKIAKNCNGLPLTVVIIAGILSNLEPDGWEEIAGRLSSSALSVIDQCMNTLELSYRKLPDYLKSCLLYFGAFPEDREINFQRLIWLWIAEGFVKKCEFKSLEDVAKDNMNDLIGRGLVMVSKEGSIGGVKTCRIHDLLHEFCVVKAKKEKFMSVLSGHEELFAFHGQCDLQRLCLFSTQEHFMRSRLYCPGVRSLIFFAADEYQFESYHITYIFGLFKLLKVLNLIDIRLGTTFPSEILLLVDLRYLAVKGGFNSIPSAIVHLSNLETLVVDAFEVSLPGNIWDMLKLRVLSGRFSYPYYYLAESILESSYGLHHLNTFSSLCVAIGGIMEKIMRKFPSIRRLKFDLFVPPLCNTIVAMDFLSQLESLHLYGCDSKNVGFHFPGNLKKLTLSNMHSSVIPKSEEVPNLVVLKLSSVGFEGKIWDMKEKWEFPKLKFLELKFLGIVRWIGSDGDDHFPCLQKLVLKSCHKLEEVPSCLGDLTPLQMIEVHRCPESVASLLVKIMEDQINWGNADIKMLTS